MNTLVVDIGGTHIKILATDQTESRQMDSDSQTTAPQMVDGVLKLAAGWAWQRVSIGYPGIVVDHKPVEEPTNLGPGWVGFDYERAFGCPVRIINDAAMQALGSYEGGRMLFIGLGTGLGTAMVIEGRVQPLELTSLPYRDGKTFEQCVGKGGLETLGRSAWQDVATDAIKRLQYACCCDYTVIGGGAAELLDELPEGARRGDNNNAFTGGFLLWDQEQ